MAEGSVDQTNKSNLLFEHAFQFSERGYPVGMSGNQQRSVQRFASNFKVEGMMPSPDAK